MLVIILQVSLSFSFIGAPQGARVSLLTEAKLHNNTRLVDFINSLEPYESKDVIYMNNDVKIQLSKYTDS